MTDKNNEHVMYSDIVKNTLSISKFLTQNILTIAVKAWKNDRL